MTTLSAAIDCSAGQVCDVNVSDIFFDETFVAEPAPGWHFAGWKARQGGLCVAETGDCRVDASEFEDLSILDDPGVIHYLEPKFVVDRTTDGIVSSGSQSVMQGGANFDLEFYRNTTYSCGLSGKYSFMAINPAYGNATTEAPLWVYLHGGGTGFFGENGDYIATNNLPQETWNTEQDTADLIEILQSRTFDGNGQVEDNTLTRRINAGYRMLVVTMCDHDSYSGLGTPYPNNPVVGAEVNGMQATMSALEYTVSNYPTTHVFVHGTSAGSSGAYNLAMSFAVEGIHLTALVSDSVVSPRQIQLSEAYPDNRPPVEGIAEKIGFYTDLEIGIHPEARIDDGFDAAPLMFVGGVEDPFCQADQPAIPEAAALGLNNCEWQAQGVIDAIAAQSGSPHEVALIAGAGHVPTIQRVAASNAVDSFISSVLANSPPDPFADADGDGVPDSVDNCRAIANPDQTPSLQNPECGAACVTAVCGPAICSNPEF
ncbi:thrombospondin type 3 repeat-containing protein [Halioglobus sp.]|nr:thrombospondin type 3 repeat-containing protein [Halioglobus sp.]